jgi:hypothetical protein
MNRGTRQIIAEKVASTVRILELLGLDYSVGAPKRAKVKGNKSPRVVSVNTSSDGLIRIYNGVKGNTWANREDGKPLRGVKSIEDLYNYLRGNNK